MANAQKKFKIHVDEKGSIPFVSVIDLGNNKSMKVTATPIAGESHMKELAENEALISLKTNDLWADGSGYQLLLDADATAYGNEIPLGNLQFPGGDVSDEIYNAFEYKIPVNADGAVNTENLIVSGIQSITVPAGIYDYLVTNPTPSDNQVWISSASCDPARGNDFEIRAGYYYTFELGRSDGYDCVTINSGEMPESPVILVDKDEMFFANTLTGEPVSDVAVIEALSLNGNITITAPEHFKVSSDGETFSASAQMTGSGLLYIQFDPSIAGELSGDVTLASPDINTITISVSGMAIDCDDILLPINQGFEDYSSLCWQAVQGSPYPNNQMGLNKQFVHEGIYSWMFSSYEPNFNYNQYLITPALPETTNSKYISFYYNDAAGYGETFAVGYSATTDDLDNFTWLDDEEVTTGEADVWLQHTTVIPGNAKYMAINYRGGTFYLFVDDIEISEITGPVAKISPNKWNTGQVNVGETKESVEFILKNIGIGTLSVSDNTILETPWSTTFNKADISLAADEEYLFTFSYSPTEEGMFTADFEITANSGSKTVNLSGLTADCEYAGRPPVEQDFEGLSYLCWTGIYGSTDEDNGNELGLYDHSIDQSSHSGAHSGIYSWTFSSIAETWDDVYDQYLVSPEILVEENSDGYEFSFYFSDYNGYGGESFRVGYSSSLSIDIDDFTWFDEVVTDANKDWHYHTQIIPSDASYIAINYTPYWKYRLLIDDIKIDAIPVSGINDISDNQLVKVYPNPSEGEVNIKVSEASIVKIIDAFGRILNTYNIEAGKTLNINQPSGIYFIRSESNGKAATQKLIVK